jgi:hypothetical protein
VVFEIAFSFIFASYSWNSFWWVLKWVIKLEFVPLKNCLS